MENELGGEQSMACGPPIPILHYLNLIVREGNERIIIFFLIIKVESIYNVVSISAV